MQLFQWMPLFSKPSQQTEIWKHYQIIISISEAVNHSILADTGNFPAICYMSQSCTAPPEMPYLKYVFKDTFPPEMINALGPISDKPHNTILDLTG